MAATDQQILDKARDSLARILDTDSSSWSEGQRAQRQLEIDKLESLITKYEARVVGANGRQIVQPVRRVNI